MVEIAQNNPENIERVAAIEETQEELKVLNEDVQGLEETPEQIELEDLENAEEFRESDEVVSDQENLVNNQEEVVEANQELKEVKIKAINSIKEIKKDLLANLINTDKIDGKYKDNVQAAIESVFPHLEKDINDDKKGIMMNVTDLRSLFENAFKDSLGFSISSLGKTKEIKGSIEAFFKENNFSSRYEEINKELVATSGLTTEEVDRLKDGFSKDIQIDIEDNSIPLEKRKERIKEIEEKMTTVDEKDSKTLQERYRDYIMKQGGVDDYAVWKAKQTDIGMFDSGILSIVKRLAEALKLLFTSDGGIFSGENWSNLMESWNGKNHVLEEIQEKSKELEEEQAKEEKKQGDIEGLKKVAQEEPEKIKVSNLNDNELNALDSEQIIALQEIFKEKGGETLLGVSLQKNLKIETLLKIKEKQDFLKVEKVKDEFKLSLMRKNIEVRELDWNDEDIMDAIINIFDWNELKLTGSDGGLTELEISDLGELGQPNLNKLLDDFEKKGDKDLSAKALELRELIKNSEKVRHFLKQLNKTQVAAEIGSNGTTKTGELTLKLLQEINNSSGFIELDLNDGDDKVNINKDVRAWWMFGEEGDLKAQINGEWIDFDTFDQLGKLLGGKSVSQTNKTETETETKEKEE